MRYAAAGGAVVALLLLAGCGSESDQTSGQESTVSPSTQPPDPDTPTPSTPASSTPTGPAQGPVEQAKADLAGRLGLGPGQVTLVSAEEVTWRDGGLGCPQRGMRYTQVLVNGSRIVLEAGGRRYEYHSGGRRGPFLCTNPQPPVQDGG
ncbi:hypothetical protein E1218_15575 [Kribbella turkmenica]|uniref:Lipoprotein n=1 Tax=Kribbella turkmenica TaxID=2530375 RepID=A0A4R4X3Z7_9ACTN|nr:hypothetical protein [Kribbella turkmenica]TDD25031.1 hypothetical protein E1218_15575 [Kribbella turkmenica]